jgi:hypothetical protein
LILENCVATARCAAIARGSEPKEPSLQLTRNTFRANVCAVEFQDRPNKAFEDAKQKSKALLFKATGNIFDSSRVLVFTQHPSVKILSPADAERRLAQLLGWKGERNLYSVLYLTPGSIACADLWTIIFANHASTSDDDVFGTLGSC